MSTRLIFILLSVCIVSSCAAPAKPYAFHPEPFSSTLHSQIAGPPGYGGRLFIILKLDGKATKTHADIPEDVRIRDKDLLLPNAITVAAGKHQLGIGYAFSDVSGKLVTTDIAKAYERLYLPKEKRDFVTVWHYEEFEITTKSGMNYQLGREFDTKTERLRITVSECTGKKLCKPVEIVPVNVRDNAFPVGPDLLNEIRSVAE
jgi:hypothetical protein